MIVLLLATTVAVVLAIRPRRYHRRTWRAVRLTAGVVWLLVLGAGLVTGTTVLTTTTTVIVLACVAAVGAVVLARLLRAARLDPGPPPRPGAQDTPDPARGSTTSPPAATRAMSVRWCPPGR